MATPKHLAQDADLVPQDGAGVLDVARGPLQVGESLPAVCTVADVARVLGVTPSAVHKLREAGRLREFLLPSLGDRKARYCGRKLQAWLDGEFASTRSFGRSRHRVA
jgi:hypothetical protein